MKKTLFSTTILTTLVIILSANSTYSQTTTSVNKNQLNIGVGLSSWGVPIYIGIDHSVHPDFTIGGEFTYRSYREKWNSKYYSHNVMGFSGNVNYHFNTLLSIPRKWDFYAGLNIGFFVWGSPNDYNGHHNSGLGLGGQIGGRYYFSNKIGINLEFGGGNAFSGGKIGITIKL
jgi:outer membrane immunogenic protein